MPEAYWYVVWKENVARLGAGVSPVTALRLGLRQVEEALVESKGIDSVD